MKQFLLFTFLSVFTLGLQAQVVFVDADATGTADGTSWANAYTDLAAALEVAEAGSSVWVADGRYVTPTDTSFVIDKELTLLGGFNGTEADAAAADPAVNETILSGDVNGDDVEGVFDTTTRQDNQRVLFVADSSLVGSSFTATIAGFTIRDGNREGFVPNGFINPFAGGGIYATGRIVASDLVFVDNYGEFGAAVCVINANANNSTFDNITITDNYTGPRSAFYNRTTDGVVIRNSTFGAANQDTTASGMIFALNCVDFTVETSTFDSVTTDGRGGAIHVQGTLGTTTISSLEITNCSADLGGALYLRNFSPEDVDPSVVPTGNTVIENTTISGVSSQRWGGAIFVSQVNSVMNEVNISNVQGGLEGNIGAAVYLQSNAALGDFPLTIEWNDLFIDDVVNNGDNGGGIFMFIDPDYRVSINNSTINEAVSIGSGGGMQVQGFGPSDSEDNFFMCDNLTVTNCSVRSRSDGSGGFGGGALFLGQDVVITKSTFSGNEGLDDNGNGGGLYFQRRASFDEDDVLIEEFPQVVRVSRSTFTNNRSVNGSGLASFGEEQQVTVTDCTFEENGTFNAGNAHRGGGMAFFSGTGSNIVIEDCLFSANSVTDDEFISGGAGVYFGSRAAPDSTPATVIIRNNSFLSNVARDDANGGALYFVNGVNATVQGGDMTINSGQEGGAIASIVLRDEIDDSTSTFPPFNVDVEGVLFDSNTSSSQGGAVSTQRTVMDFTNCAFVNNGVSTTATGGGGAIIFNGAAPFLDGDNNLEGVAPAALEANLVNNTFLNNKHSGAASAVGNAVALFQPQNPFAGTPELSLTVNFQNNAFFTSGEDELQIELEPSSEEPTDPFGDISVNSFGGNFFNAENGVDTEGALGFDETGDVFNLEITDARTIFEDPDAEDSEFPLLRPLPTDPESDNPLIDAGTTGPLVPETGIDGNPRGESPDIGAYELDFDATSVQEIADSGLDLDFFPNPTTDAVNIRSNDGTITNYTVLVADNNGRILRSARFNGTVNRLDLTNVPTGVYNLQLVIDGNVYSKQIVKQ